MNTTTISTETRVDAAGYGEWVIEHVGETILEATFVTDAGSAVTFGEGGIVSLVQRDDDPLAAAFDDYTLSVTIDGVTLEIRDFVERVGTV